MVTFIVWSYLIENIPGGGGWNSLLAVLSGQRVILNSPGKWQVTRKHQYFLEPFVPSGALERLSRRSSTFVSLPSWTILNYRRLDFVHNLYLSICFLVLCSSKIIFKKIISENGGHGHYRSGQMLQLKVL